MRRFLLAFTTLSVTFGSVWAINVSTEPQNKKALIEEFTGINCGNCPDGHAIAAKLQLAQPENVYTIAIHAGHYAEPSVGQPNFIIEEGTTINDYYGVTGYPSGMVNRRTFSGSTPIISRSYWTQSAREICLETAIVNLAVECQYNEFRSEYTITVAGYYTESSTVESNNLCVALVQNNIQGYQAGSGVSDEYMHQHMLRDYVTPTWGDPISETSKGSYFEKTYTVTLPEAIGSANVVPAQIEAIAFITTGEGGEILNVASGRVNPEQFDLPLAAEISAYKIPISKNYGYGFIEMYLDNKSSQPITSATFQVTLNGVSTNVDWSGNVPAMTKQPISIDVDWQATQTDDNAYSIALTALNGEKYSGNSFKGTFGGITEVTTSTVVKFKTDNYFSDNTFTLKDDQGNIVRTFGPYEDGVQAVYEELVTFEPNKVYCFEITDAWGNGILSPRGNIKLYDPNANLLAQNLDITNHGWRLFVKATMTSDIDDTYSSEDITISCANGAINVMSRLDCSIAIYDITGRCAYSASGVSQISTDTFGPGLYVVKAITPFGGKTQKIIIE